MPRTCTICGHQDREAIDQALVAGEPFRNIARRFSVSRPALFRHKEAHLPQTLLLAVNAAEVARGGSLLEQVRSLQAKALVILSKAEAAGDLRVAVGAIREARGNMELLAKLVGELDERPTVNVLVAPAWVSMRSRIVRALEPYPEARQSVCAALAEVESDAGR